MSEAGSHVAKVSTKILAMNAWAKGTHNFNEIKFFIFTPAKRGNISKTKSCYLIQ